MRLVPSFGRALLAVLLPSVSLVSRAEGQATASNTALPPIVSGSWLAAELARPDLVILQVAPDSDFVRGHIPGALPLDLTREFLAPAVVGGLRTELPDPAALQSVLRSKGIGPATRVVLIYDQPQSFTRASRAFFTLEWAGMAGRVAVLDGGLPKWRADGRYVATGGPRRHAPGVVEVAVQADRVVSTEQVRAAIGRPGTAIIDARDAVFYDDERPNGMPRGGHIPSAINLPHNTVFASDGTFKSKAELEQMVRNAGISDNDALISYCHIGMQASWMYLTLRHLGREVQLYDGSFDAWSRDSALPVEGAKPKP